MSIILDSGFLDYDTEHEHEHGILVRNPHFFLYHTFWIGLLGTCLILATGCAWRGKPATANPQAYRLAAKMIKAMGGSRALAKIRYLRFDISLMEGGREVMRRSHLWSRRTGDYRIDGKKEGDPYRTIFNVHTLQGRAFEGLRLKPAQNQQAALEEAFAIYRHDVWWLLGGLLTREPGVHLEDVGIQTVAGRSGPTLTVRFDEAADPTPGLIWSFHLDPRTHLPFAWSFVKTGRETEGRTVYLWTRMLKLRKLNLPVRFEEVGTRRAVLIDRLFEPVDAL